MDQWHKWYDSIRLEAIALPICLRRDGLTVKPRTSRTAAVSFREAHFPERRRTMQPNDFQDQTFFSSR
jgi:hypothetical protein